MDFSGARANALHLTRFPSLKQSYSVELKPLVTPAQSIQWGGNGLQQWMFHCN